MQHSSDRKKILSGNSILLSIKNDLLYVVKLGVTAILCIKETQSLLFKILSLKD